EPDQVVRSAEQRAAALDDLHAQRRHAHRLPVALDQARAERGFEFLQAGRQRRLGDEAVLRGLREIQPLGDRDEVGELAQRRKRVGHRIRRYIGKIDLYYINNSLDRLYAPTDTSSARYKPKRRKKMNGRSITLQNLEAAFAGE